MNIGDDCQINMLSREVSKFHKYLFGKGPNRVTIICRQNLVGIKATGVLTQIEKNLLETAYGEKVVTEIRHRLISKFKNKIIREISEITGVNYVEVGTELFIESDELIMVLC